MSRVYKPLANKNVHLSVNNVVHHSTSKKVLKQEKLLNSDLPLTKLYFAESPNAFVSHLKTPAQK